MVAASTSKGGQTAEHDSLVHQGTRLMLDRVLKDLQVGMLLLLAPPPAQRAPHPPLLQTHVQAEDEALQARALQALQSITKGARGSGASMPLPAVQAAFRAGGGLPRLVGLLDTAVSPKLGEQRAAIVAGAIDALAAMTRNSPAARSAHVCFCPSIFKYSSTNTNAQHRREAIAAGAVPALCAVLGTGDDEPVSIEVLKSLYTIIAPDASGP
jgi:hypothetical protein